MDANYKTDEALRTRSLIYQLDTFKAAALVLNGAKDDRTDPAQASRLAAELTRKGRDARAIVYPDYGHMIPVNVRNKDIDPLIDRLFVRRAPTPRKIPRTFPNAPCVAGETIVHQLASNLMLIPFNTVL